MPDDAAAPLSRRALNQQARRAAKARRAAEASAEQFVHPSGCMCNATCRTWSALDAHEMQARAAPRAKSRTEFDVFDKRYSFRS